MTINVKGLLTYNLWHKISSVTPVQFWAGEKMVSNALRICHPVDFQLLLYHNQGNTFRGLFAGLLMTSLSDLIHNSNLTFEIQPHKGYTGCIEMIQQNQSDIVMTLADYPVDADDVTQGHVITDSVMQFISVYYKTDEKVVAQILSCFESFSPALWSLIIATVVTIYLLKRFRVFLLKSASTARRTSRFALKKLTKRHQRNRYHLYGILTHMTRIDRVNEKGFFNKTLFVLLSFKSLILVQYFFTLIKTDLVVVKQPEIYQSYDDLLENDVLVSFYKGLGQEKYFKFAPHESRERALWNFSMSKRNEEQIMFGFEVDAELFGEKVVNLMQRKEVLALDNIFTPIFQVLACKLRSDEQQAERIFKLLNINRSVDSMILHVAQDPNAIRSRKTFLYSKYFNGPSYRRIYGRLKHSFELGITHQLLFEVGRLDASDVAGVTTPTEPEKLKTLRLCIDGVKVQSKVTLDALMFQNMRSFIYVISSLLTISGVTALVELLNIRLSLVHRPNNEFAH